MLHQGEFLVLLVTPSSLSSRDGCCFRKVSRLQSTKELKLIGFTPKGTTLICSVPRFVNQAPEIAQAIIIMMKPNNPILLPPSNSYFAEELQKNKLYFFPPANGPDSGCHRWSLSDAGTSASLKQMEWSLLSKGLHSLWTVCPEYLEVWKTLLWRTISLNNWLNTFPFTMLHCWLWNGGPRLRTVLKGRSVC